MMNRKTCTITNLNELFPFVDRVVVKISCDMIGCTRVQEPTVRGGKLHVGNIGSKMLRRWGLIIVVKTVATPISCMTHYSANLAHRVFSRLISISEVISIGTPPCLS